MDPFVEQLKRLCRDYPTRAKWVFVPGHAVGRTIGERIARDGTNWLNLRFVTPLDIALQMGAPFLVDRGIDPSEEGLGPALMMRLLLDLQGEAGYFRPLAKHPTLAQALWMTLRELRMAGIRPAALKPEMFSSPAKQAELVALFTAYERFLDEHKRADMASVYEEALAHPDWCPIQPLDCWTALPGSHWNPRQRALIDSMPGERIVPRAFAVSGASMPRRSGSQCVEPVPAESAANALPYLMTPAAAPAPVSGKTAISLFHAGGREAEIEEVFRRILGVSVPLDHVEIACASEAHVALVWEKALRHHWPATLGPGTPAVVTRPGRALIGLCDWIETDFSAGHLRRLLQSGDLGLEKGDEGFTANEAARLIARAEAAWGTATYGLALGRLHSSYTHRAADRDASDEDRAYARTKAEQTAKVRTWITGLVASVPEPAADGNVPLQAVVSAVLEFLERTTARSNALDHRAAASLRDHVGELRALGSFSCGLPEALRFIRERVESLSVAPERPRPGHLHVCSLSESGYAGRPHLFIVGLEEGRVFSSATEDAVLLDAERQQISPDLRLSRDRIDEAVSAVLERLAASEASVTFSYSCRDTREFRETYASWLMLQAFRLQRGDETLSYRDMKAALGEPKSAVPADREAALSSAGWWLRTVTGTGDEGITVLTSPFAGVVGGRAADVQRRSHAFTEFDGYVADAGATLDPASPERVFSVTELEKAAECPFRFFLKHGLGVRPVDRGERDKDVWLDHLTRGLELHDLYAALLRRVRDERRRPNENDRVWLLARAQEQLDRINEEMPAATPEILARESKDFLADVELFFDAELDNSRSKPVGIEVSFGRPLNGDEHDPLARAEPLVLDLGRGVKLRVAGRMDLIDQVGPSTFQVVDYKSGGYYWKKWQGVFDGGRRLQHALYGLAAVELLKSRYTNPKVLRGVYYFPSHKGRRHRVPIAAPARADIVAVMKELRDVISGGRFIRTPDADRCRFCDYAAACGKVTNEQAKNKQQDSKLDAYQKLIARQ